VEEKVFLRGSVMWEETPHYLAKTERREEIHGRLLQHERKKGGTLTTPIELRPGWTCLVSRKKKRHTVGEAYVPKRKGRGTDRAAKKIV